MPAGSSGKPLAVKLGIKPDYTVGLIAAPAGAENLLQHLPEGVDLRLRAQGRFDVIVFFCRRRRQLESRFAALAARLASNGGLWVAWPKKSSKLDTDLSFEAVQRTGLAAGLVDNKVCATSAARASWLTSSANPRSPRRPRQ